MLYVSLGEDAFPSAAQDTSTLRGVILRLDVSRLPDGPGSAARALVTPPGNPFGSTGGLNARLLWEYGLRNPFRLQVDPMTGTLLIADVGESTWEEVDLAPVGGLDFGWPHYEGDMVYSSVALTGSPTFPIYVINHTTGAKAVISAGIYRHPAGGTRAFPAEYEGDAFISDYYAGFMRRLHQTGCTILLVEHNLPFVRSLADEIVALDRGRLLAHGSTEEVFALPAFQRSYVGVAAT